MIRKIFTGILLFFSVITNVAAQKTLIVDKVGHGKHLEYRTDDVITIFTGDPEFKTTGIISAISDSTITINGTYTVEINKISRIRMTRMLLYGGKHYLFASSAVYPAIGIINHALNKEKLFDRSMITYPAVLLSAGMLARIFQYRNIRTGTHWKLKVVEFHSSEEKSEQQ